MVLKIKKNLFNNIKNGALFNEFLNKQQFDDLKNEIEDQKYNRLHQQKEIFDKFFLKITKKYLKREKIYTTKYMMYLKN